MFSSIKMPNVYAYFKWNFILKFNKQTHNSQVPYILVYSLVISVYQHNQTRINKHVKLLTFTCPNVKQ